MTTDVSLGTILHISDLHFGSPYRPELGNAVLRLEKKLTPDLTICSGDIVQWCESKTSWKDARAFFDQLIHPYLTIPGNHDLPRLKVWQRFRNLYTPYRQALGTPEDSTFQKEGLCVVGLATGAIWSADLGYLGASQLDWMSGVFDKCPEGSLRGLVQHQAAKP